MSVIRPIFDSKANNKNRDFPYNFVGYNAGEFCYKGDVGYKAKISDNLVCGLMSDVDCNSIIHSILLSGDEISMASLSQLSAGSCLGDSIMFFYS